LHNHERETRGDRSEKRSLHKHRRGQ
jgi:hypothetical protein